MRAAIKAVTPRRYRQAVRRYALGIARLIYRGSRVECPCCGGTFRKFAPFAGKNAQCPGCGSLARHRLLMLHLRERYPRAGHERVLHFAPEPSVQNWLRKLPDVEYTSADLDSPLATVHTDITAIPYPERSFDLILCIHVLEHVEDDGAAIRELFRVLKPGGLAIVQVPITTDRTFEDPSITDPGERARAFGQFDHVRRCGSDYPARLETVGFEIEEVDFADGLDADRRARYVVDRGEVFYLCRRPEAGPVEAG